MIDGESFDTDAEAKLAFSRKLFPGMKSPLSQSEFLGILSTYFPYTEIED